MRCEARIFAGIHFRFAMVNTRTCAEQIAASFFVFPFRLRHQVLYSLRLVSKPFRMLGGAVEN